ncbi:MAG: hypothetical protein ACPGRZ_15345 [Alphaproteobacteria bacterium]
MALLSEFLSRCRPILCAAVLFAAPPALSQTFFHAIEDLPVAPGLTESVDEGVSFDSPGGRIVTAIARGAGDMAAYRRFYADALPPLGWKRQDGGGYRRDGEALSLDFNRRGAGVEMRVRVVPTGSEKAR